MLSSCASAAVTTDASGRVHGRVVSVSDGDTVVIRFASGNETVRLLGIDTPETVHPRKPVECFGPESSAHTKKLLPRGTMVHIVRDVEARDRFQRLLAYVYRSGDNMFINMELIAGGWGVPLSIAPNTAHEIDFAAAAYTAQTSRLGLWGQCRR